MEAFLGSIILFAGNFNPRGWFLCQGQILPISQYTALFSLLGTTYGGNGQTTFGLPDLRGRVPVGQGQGPGLQPYSLGQVGGAESVTLLTTQMPAHNHTVAGSTNAADAGAPGGTIPGSPQDGSGNPIPIYSPATGANTTMAPQMIGAAGGSQPHENRTPFLCMNYIICYEGIYPSRS